jgi:ComF family protein
MQPTRFGSWIQNVTNNNYLDDMRSTWFYNDVLHNLIHSLKYNDLDNFDFDLGVPFGKEILKDEIGAIDLIMPVPTYWLKKWERGYNQAFFLAKGLASIYTIPVDTSIIKRTRYTISQTMLGSTERMVNLDYAFTINKFLNNQHILLADDVLTTRSTISICAKVLRENGAARISGITCTTPSEDIRND